MEKVCKLSIPRFYLFNVYLVVIFESTEAVFFKAEITKTGKVFLLYDSAAEMSFFESLQHA
jgi:hypothetical protein